MGLIYPVISMDAKYTHLPSRANVLGEQPNYREIDKLSPNKNIKADTPPAFMVHTGADTRVSVTNSILMYEAMQEKGLSAEMHIYADGPHGLGMVQNDSFPVTHAWPDQFEKWLTHLHFL